MRDGEVVDAIVAHSTLGSYRGHPPGVEWVRRRRLETYLRRVVSALNRNDVGLMVEVFGWEGGMRARGGTWIEPLPPGGV